MQELPYSAPSERNRVPILSVLRDAFADVSTVLEIGSGTGQHAVFFAAALPQLRWQPSDQGACLAGLSARVAAEGPANCLPPLALDVRRHPWPAVEADALFSANTLHIMSWEAALDLFRGISAMTSLRRLCIYGPFRYAGAFTTPSNAAFDQSLRQRDPHSGIRDFEAVDSLAEAAGFALQADHAMPANNQLLIWTRPAG